MRWRLLFGGRLDRVRGRLAGQGRHLRLGQAQFVAPALDVQPGRPTLPPAGQGRGVKAQRVEQRSEEFLEDRLARLRALLLLYWFT